MSLDQFVKKSGGSHPAPPANPPTGNLPPSLPESPKKRSRKAKPAPINEEPDEEAPLAASGATFDTDPEALRPALEEIRDAPKKLDLTRLAKVYEITGVSGMNIDEIRETLYHAVREGKTKHLRLKPKWVAKCKCGWMKSTAAASLPDPIYCGKCNTLLKFKEG
jgi:hypothetical protein